MNDIFSDEDKEKQEESNIEWKKSGIDKNERITLKINVKEANLYNAKKANDLKAKIKAKNPHEVPKGFKKISKKIKDSMEDDEDEENYILVPIFEDTNESSLMRALTDEEKKILQQNENINNIRQQENTGKDAAIEHAQKLIKEAGLKPIETKIINEERQKQGNTSANEIIAKTIKDKSLTKKMLKEKDIDLTAEKNINSQKEEKKRIESQKIKAAEKKAQQKKEEQEQEEQEQKKRSKEQEEQKQKENNTKNDHDSFSSKENSLQNIKTPVQEELTSIKTEEKAPVTPPEIEISVKKEDTKKEKSQEILKTETKEQGNTKTEDTNLSTEKMKAIIMEKSGRINNDAQQQKQIDEKNIKASQEMIEKAIKERASKIR